MTLISKPNYNQIFASNAPSIDTPAAFANYDTGWAESRNNNGKPTIKQFNYIHQNQDLKALWILQNGACLPYDAAIEYAEGSLSLKDGIIQQYLSGAWGVYKTSAANVTTQNGETQQEINDYIGTTWYARVGGYDINDKARLTTGEIVVSTIDGNTNNPNTDMTGWVLVNAASQIFDEIGKTQQEINDKVLIELNDIAELRAFEPRSNGEVVYLKGLSTGSTAGDGKWYYDAFDTTSVDNGWFIAVTASGKRFKRVGWQSAIDLDWAGIADNGDLALRWQEALNFADSIRIGVTHIFDCPKILIGGQRYTMSTGVVHPTYLSTEFKASTLIVASFARSSCAYLIALRNANNTQDIYRNAKDGVWWNHTIGVNGGKLKLVFENAALTDGTTRPSGIVSGNVSGANYAYQCNMRVTDVELTGFRAGHEILGTNSWCFRFENCSFGGKPSENTWGIWTSSTANVDSGERCTYVNCLFSGLQLTTPAMYLYFDHCSIDFTLGDVIKLNSTASYNDIRFVNCHIENFDGYVVNSALTSGGSTNTIITFNGGRILPTSFQRVNSHDIIFFNGNCNVLLTGGVFLENYAYPSSNGLGAIMAQNGANLITNNVRTQEQRPRINGDFSKISISNDFLSDVIDTVVSVAAPSVNFDVVNIGNGLTASIKASPETTANTLALASSAANGYINLRSKKFVNVQARKRYTCRPVLEITDEASTCVPRHVVYWYDADKNLISTSKPPYDINITGYISGAGVAFASRQTKRIPIVHVDYIAPASAVYAKHGFELANTVAGKTYYLHSIELHESILN